MERTNKVKKMVVTALLAAIIVVLQMLSSFMNFSGFPITLTLVPIIVGATMYGATTGAILGGAFGVITCIGVVTGTDVLGHMMFEFNPVLTLFVCMLKAILAGYIVGVVYKFFEKKNKKTLGLYVVSVLCPVINTATLCVVMIAFFESVVTEYAVEVEFSSAMNLILSGILLMNFLPELLVNIVVSPVVTKVIPKLKRN